MCVGCRCRALISELLRVVAVDGHLVVDGRRRLPGRGAWLHPDLACLAIARKRRAFPRALRVSGSLDVDGFEAEFRDRLERTSVQQDRRGIPRVWTESRKQVDPS
ncbi:MAG: YlxR family protein [Haloechinothrix sp.]